MADPARALFHSLTSYRRVQDLIDAGEAEDQYLECKAPASPQLSRDLRAKLGEAASGFGNTGGGVILWGVSTDKHPHSGLDVLTQIVPLASARRLAQQIDRELPRLTHPQMTFEASRVLHRAKRDTKGVIATYIPAAESDPVQSTIDGNFYFRTGDEFREMPYDMLRRMFVGAQAPALRPSFERQLVKIGSDGVWHVPVIVVNDSTAAAKEALLSVQVLNPSACDSISSTGDLTDQSSVNPGKTIFMEWFERPIYRELNRAAGSLVVRMKKGARRKRALSLEIQLFADRMRPRTWTFRIHLGSAGFAIRDVRERSLY